MSGRVEVRVNGDPVAVRPWARWRDAVTAWRPEAGVALSRGRGRLSDAAGGEVDPDGTVVADAEIRYEETAP